MIKKLPPGIKRLFGRPPVLPNEDLRAYNKLILQIANRKNPTDVIGWIHVKDSADDTWEVLRQRKFNVEIILMGLDGLAESACAHITDEDEKRVTMKFFRKNDVCATRAFLQGLEWCERSNSLLSSAMARRNANLRESDRHSESLALRRASDDIIDGEFTEHHPASPQAAKNVGIPDVPVKPASPTSGQVPKASIISHHDSGEPTPAASGQVTKGGSTSGMVTVKKKFAIQGSHSPKNGAA
jgi:hypothetical protein